MTISIFVSKGILSKSTRCCVGGGGERLKKEGKTAGDILHDRLTSRREQGRERVDRSRRAKWSGEFASGGAEAKMGASERFVET